MPPWLVGSLGGSIAVSSIVQRVDDGAEVEMSEFGSAWREGIAPGDYSETLTYQLRIGWDTAPQSYAGTVTYTITVS